MRTFPCSIQQVVNPTEPERPLRVLVIAACPFPQPRGSQVLIAGLAEALRQRGHVVQMITYAGKTQHSQPPGPLGDTAGSSSNHLRRPPSLFWKPLLDVLLAVRATALARQFRPDILHAHNMEGLAAGLWVRRRTGVPLVYHMHTLMEPELPTYFRSVPGRWVGRWVGRWTDHNLPRRADACIVLRVEAAAPLYAYGVAPEQIYVIPPGVDIPQPVPITVGHIRQRWGLGNGPLVLYSGNLDPYQDLPFLLRAFRQIRFSLPGAELVLATHRGNAVSYERAIRRSLQPGEHLVHVASWEEMCDLLLASDVAVSPRQLCWGFPLKILSYMAAARPIVAAHGSAQGLRHLETAWVVPNGDAAAFAQGILRLLQDRGLAGRLGQAARQDAETRYNWPSCARAVEQVYRQVLAALPENSLMEQGSPAGAV